MESEASPSQTYYSRNVQLNRFIYIKIQAQNYNELFQLKSDNHINNFLINCEGYYE